MINIYIENIDKSIIQKHKKECEKEQLCFCNNTKYIGLFIDNTLIGFAGILYNNTKITFKNDYIFENYRGNGYYKYLMKYRFFLAKDRKAKRIEATCTKMSINTYLKYGFKVIQEYKNGCKKVVYENI